MAHRMKLSAPYKGMTHIWNIDRSVGTETSEANVATDVRLVSLLTHCMWSIPGAGSAMAPGCRVVTAVGDSMIQSLGFMIYYMQVEQQNPADGVASPVPKWASDQYLVFRMNYILFNSIKGVWETLPDHPQCGAALKAELAILK